MGNYTMSKKELEQVKVFERLKNKEITQEIAGKILNITSRWVRTKFKRYLLHGADGLLHKNRGRESKRKLSPEVQNAMRELLEGKLPDAGPTLCAEKVEEIYGFQISKEAARLWMIAQGFWKGKKKKVTHRKQRERKPCFGMMVQLDGSPHDWFEGRADPCTLLVFIDDATSAILWLEFAESESTEAIMKASRGYFNRYGLPKTFYTDFGSVFSVNTNNPDREKKTQFERALNELSIKLIHAHSPQAKGRVERANQALQDRLVKEMRLADISSIKDANNFVQQKFIAKYNEKFAIKPAETYDAHRPVDGINLDKFLCSKETRVIQNDFVISYKSRQFQLEKNQKTIVRPKEQVVVSELLDGQIILSIRKTPLAFTEIKKRSKPFAGVQKNREFIYYKPTSNHPWRNYHVTKKMNNPPTEERVG